MCSPEIVCSTCNHTGCYPVSNYKTYRVLAYAKINVSADACELAMMNEIA
jgi:hypothetical protein